jgi:hypothetical protein
MAEVQNVPQIFLSQSRSEKNMVQTMYCIQTMKIYVLHSAKNTRVFRYGLWILECNGGGP